MVINANPCATEPPIESLKPLRKIILVLGSASGVKKCGSL